MQKSRRLLSQAERADASGSACRVPFRSGAGVLSSRTRSCRWGIILEHRQQPSGSVDPGLVAVVDPHPTVRGINPCGDRPGRSVRPVEAHVVGLVCHGRVDVRCEGSSLPASASGEFGNHHTDDGPCEWRAYVVGRGGGGAVFRAANVVAAAAVAGNAMIIASVASEVRILLRRTDASFLLSVPNASRRVAAQCVLKHD